MSEVNARANVLLEEASVPSIEQIAATLREVGLSGYAADTLCALVRLPQATARDLVTKTGIPDSKIYYALNELAEKGLVAVQAGKPKTYRAVPAAQARTRLEAMVAAKHEREREAVQRASALLEPIRAAATSSTTDLAYVVKGYENVVARARSMIASARREVLVLTSDESFLRRLEEGVASAARRGRSVRLAIPDVDVDRAIARKAEVRTVACDCRVVVVDGQQMLTVGETMDGSLYAITSTDETLVRLGLDYWDSPRCTTAAE